MIRQVVCVKLAMVKLTLPIAATLFIYHNYIDIGIFQRKSTGSYIFASMHIGTISSVTDLRSLSKACTFHIEVLAMIYSGNHSSHIDNKPSSAYQTFDQNITILSDVCICKCRLQNISQFIQTSMYHFRWWHVWWLFWSDKISPVPWTISDWHRDAIHHHLRFHLDIGFPHI